MSAEANGALIIEPFDAARHDRTAFSCGVAQVDNFFKRTANKLSRADNVRVFVLCDASATVLGFYALNAHGIDHAELPPRFARNRPGHGTIPAAFISMIGVDQKHAGQGYGGDLLVDALLRIVRIADQIGLAVVVLDILDDGDQALIARRKALYARYGFAPLPSNPLRLFLPIDTIRRLRGRDAAPD